MPIFHFVREILVITEKNMALYYTRAPLLMFGLLFPFFMFLAFYVGRDLDMATFFPGFFALMLFFTASSVGPLITPWEKKEKTYERLLSYPVTLDGIILGDVLAGALFGGIISLVIWGVSFLGASYFVVNSALFVLALFLGMISCASLGVFLASPSSNNPPNVMIFSNLIRLPLIFISGIFVPLTQMSGLSATLASLSPLTYLVDLFQASISGNSHFSPIIDIIILIATSLVFITMARIIQKQSLTHGL